MPNIFWGSWHLCSFSKKREEWIPTVSFCPFDWESSKSAGEVRLLTRRGGGSWFQSFYRQNRKEKGKDWCEATLIRADYGEWMDSLMRTDKTKRLSNRENPEQGWWKLFWWPRSFIWNLICLFGSSSFISFVLFHAPIIGNILSCNISFFCFNRALSDLTVLRVIKAASVETFHK